jgi:hypothetical protein
MSATTTDNRHANPKVLSLIQRLHHEILDNDRLPK